MNNLPYIQRGTIYSLMTKLPYRENGRYYIKRIDGGKKIFSVNIVDYPYTAPHSICWIYKNKRVVGDNVAWYSNSLSVLKKLVDVIADNEYMYGYGKTLGKNKFQVMDRKTGFIVYSK